MSKCIDVAIWINTCLNTINTSRFNSLSKAFILGQKLNISFDKFRFYKFGSYIISILLLPIWTLTIPFNFNFY